METHEIISVVILAILFSVLFYVREIRKLEKIIKFEEQVNKLAKNINQMSTAEIQMLIESNKRFDSKLDLLIDRQHNQDLRINDLKTDVKNLQIDVSEIKGKKQLGTDGITISLKWKIIQKILLWVGGSGGILTGAYQIFETIKK